MLLTCALQVGGVISDQASSQPIREKNVTVGRSYDTTSGIVVTMTMDTIPDVTMTPGRIEMDRQVRLIPLSSADDVTKGGQLITIQEVKTPTSPSEPPPAGPYDITKDVSAPGARNLNLPEGGASLLAPRSPLDELILSPALSPGYLSGRTSPSIARVVC